MMETQQEHVFALRGGHIALDFVNTVDGMRGVAATERLPAYADLVDFGVQTGALSADEAAALRETARRAPEAAAAALGRALALREALYRVLIAAIEGRPPPADDLAHVNDALAAGLAHRRLAPGADGRLALAWDAERDPDAVTWRIADAAAALLTSGDLSRVRMCAACEDERCSWLFVDRTKARTRRWCSMDDCGNRAKQKRHYHRKVKVT
jgi:predicted RNA-binding Zn ribbon-like protein